MNRNAALQLQRILLGSAGNRIDYGNDLARTIRSLGGADPFVGDLYLPADRDAYGRPRIQIPLDPSAPVPYLEGASYDEAARRLGQRFEGPLSEMAERAAFEVKRGGAPIVDGTTQHHAALLQSMGIGAKGNPSLVRQNIMALALLRNPEFREVFERSNVGQVPRRLAALLAARNLNAPGLSIGDLESGRNALEGSRAGLHQFYETADQATQRRLPQGSLTQVDLDLNALRGLQGFSANEFGPSIDLAEGTIKGHPASRGVFNALDVRPNATMRSSVPFQDIGGPNVGGTARGIAMDAGQLHADDLTKMERHSPWMATPSQLGPDGLTKAEPRTLLSRIAVALGVRPEQITNDHVREYTRMASAQGIDRAMSRFELPEGTRLDPTGSYLIGRDGRPVSEPRASVSGPLRLPGELTEPRIDVEPLSDRQSSNFRKLRSIILQDEIGTPEERMATRGRSASRLEAMAGDGRRVPPPDIGGALDPNRFDQQAVSFMGEESPLENRTDPRAVGRRSWQQVGDQTAASLGEKGRRQLRITVDMAFERAKQLVTSTDQTNRILALEDQIKGSFNALEASLNDPEAKRTTKLQAAFTTMRMVEGTINELTPILGREAAPLSKHLQTAGAMFLEGANAERAGQGRRLRDSTPTGPEEPSNLEKIRKNTAIEKLSGHRKSYSNDGKPPVSFDDPRPMPENRRRGREALGLLQSMGLSDPTEAFGVATSDPTKVPEIEAEFKRNRDSADLARLPSDSGGRKRFVHKIRILSGILGKDPEVVIREMQATGTKARRVDGELKVTDRGTRKGQPRDLINFRRMMTALGIDVEGLTSGVVGSQYERESASQKLSRQTGDARRLMDTLEGLSDESLSRLSAVAKTRGSGGPKEIRRQLAIELNALRHSKGSGYRKSGVAWAPGVGGDGSVQPTPVMQRDPNAAVRMDASRKNVKSGSATVPVSEFAESSAEKHPNYRQAQLNGATPAQLAELKSKLEERTESKLGGRTREIPKDPVAPPEDGGKQGIARGAGSARAIANARTDEVFTRIFGVDRGTGKRPVKRTIQVKDLELVRGRSSGDFSANLKALATEAYKRGITIDFSPEAMAVIRRRTPRSSRGNVLRLIQELKDKPQQSTKPTRKQGAPSSRAGQITTIRKMIEEIKNNPDMPDREAKIRLVKKRIAEAQGSSNDSGFKRRIRAYRKKATAAANESRGAIDFGPIEISLQRLNNAIRSVRGVRGR